MDPDTLSENGMAILRATFSPAAMTELRRQRSRYEERLETFIPRKLRSMFLLAHLSSSCNKCWMMSRCVSPLNEIKELTRKYLVEALGYRVLIVTKGDGRTSGKVSWIVAVWGTDTPFESVMDEECITEQEFQDLMKSYRTEKRARKLAESLKKRQEFGPRRRLYSGTARLRTNDD